MAECLPAHIRRSKVPGHEESPTEAMEVPGMRENEMFYMPQHKDTGFISPQNLLNGTPIKYNIYIKR